MFHFSGKILIQYIERLRSLLSPRPRVYNLIGRAAVYINSCILRKINIKIKYPQTENAAVYVLMAQIDWLRCK